MPPGAIRVGPQRTPRLAAHIYSYPKHATLDNNIAVVRMVPGTSGRIRFDLMIYSIRPYDARSWWQKRTGQRPPRGRLRLHFKREVELR